VERQECVADEIGRDSVPGGRLGVDEYLVMLEDRLDNLVSEVVGDVTVDHDKDWEADGAVILT
jgi:hypothetical protein